MLRLSVVSCLLHAACVYLITTRPATLSFFLYVYSFNAAVPCGSHVALCAICQAPERNTRFCMAVLYLNQRVACHYLQCANFQATMYSS